MKIGTSGTAARTATAEEATAASRPLVVETIPTAINRCCPDAASPIASAGVLAPSSSTLNPCQRRRSATIATGNV